MYLNLFRSNSARAVSALDLNPAEGGRDAADEALVDTSNGEIDELDDDDNDEEANEVDEAEITPAAALRLDSSCCANSDFGFALVEAGADADGWFSLMSEELPKKEALVEEANVDDVALGSTTGAIVSL
jgi:hypothetical protein